MRENVGVSILCITYNQSGYIKKALDSFLMQKTDFKYEILIHDDASTDGTSQIVADYAKQYPNQIMAVLQKENQYSQQIPFLYKYLLPKARGKYFAFCEGDDYWTDPYKLQKQYDYMQAHPECTLCVHNAIRVDSNGNFVCKYTVSPISRSIRCETVVQRCGGFCATSSIFAPTQLLRDRPDYMKDNSHDFVLQTYLASCGKTYCFRDSMSAYRINQSTSWVGRMHKNRDAFWEYRKKMDKTMEGFDAFTEFQYHDAVAFACARGRVSALAAENRCEELLTSECRKVWMDPRYPLRRKAGILRRLAVYFIERKR